MSIILIFSIIVSYLIGSICSAIIVAKICHLPDPRQFGSHNPGATNVLRLSGKKYAAIVLGADLCKGLIPVGIASLCHIKLIIIGAIGLAAVVGHIYPIFFKFKGGKGVATTLGVLFGINPLLGLTICLIWLIIALITKYSSLAALLSLLCAPLLAILFTGKPEIFPALFGIWILIVYTHQNNVLRLRDGAEPTINWRKK